MQKFVLDQGDHGARDGEQGEEEQRRPGEAREQPGLLALLGGRLEGEGEAGKSIRTS